MFKNYSRTTLTKAITYPKDVVNDVVESVVKKQKPDYQDMARKLSWLTMTY
jgi:hypothetical protein